MKIRPDDRGDWTVGPWLIVMALVLVAWTTPAKAQTDNWNVGSGDWNTASNWSDGVPGNAYTVNITGSDTNGPNTITYDYPGPAVNLYNLTIDLTGGYDFATLLQSANSLSVTRANVAEAGGGTETIGYNGNGAVNQSGGTDVAQDLILGANAGSQGDYTLSGTGSLSAGTIGLNEYYRPAEYIGFSGNAVFNQTGGTNTAGVGSEPSSVVNIAANAGSTGTYNLSGGTLTAADFTVGGDDYFAAGGTGDFVLSGSGIANIGGLRIWNSGGTTVNINGGTLNVGTIDTSAGSPSQVVWTAGTINVTNSAVIVDPTQVAGDTNFGGSLSIGAGQILIASEQYETVGNTGAGTITQTGGSNTAEQLTLGNNSGSTGAYNQSGGTNTQQNFLVLGYSSGSTGTYNLSGGSLTDTLGEIIGDAGNGTLNQTGGTNAAANVLLGGNFLAGGGSGAYNLSGSGLLSSTGIEVLGIVGPGVFNQSGGTNNAPGDIYCGGNAAGTYTLSGGTLNTPTFYLGGNNVDFELLGGAGTFTISGSGVATISGTLEVWNVPNTTVNINGGTLNVGLIDTSSGSLSEVSWTAGTINVTNSNIIVDPTQVSTATNFGGSLSIGSGQTLMQSAAANSEIIGDSGAGTVTQTGGSNSAVNLYLGYLTGSSGTYNLGSAGVFSIAAGGEAYVGYIAAGTFNQSGGVSTLNGSLLLGLASTSTGTYNLSGSGVISCVAAGSEIIGYSHGTGYFTQTGGTNSFTTGANLWVGFNTSSTGTYALAGTGSLSVSGGEETVGNSGAGTFNQTGGTNTIAGGNLNIAAFSGSTGTYNLSGGSGNFGAVYVGGTSSGSGGTGHLNIGGIGSLTATSITVYNTTGSSIVLNGGSTSTAALNIDGSFTYDSGTHSLGAISINSGGNLAGNPFTIDSTESLILASGGIISSSILSVAAGGSMSQSGGTLSSPVLSIGGLFTYSSGTFGPASVAIQSGGEFSQTSFSNNALVQILPGGLLAGSSMTNAAGGQITGAGTVTTAITNNGIIEPDGGAMTFIGTISNQNTVIIPGGAEGLFENFTANIGTISLSGGTFSNNGQTLSNSSQITGYGILETGGLTNTSTGSLTLSGPSSIYGPVTNNAGALIHLSGSTPNIFYGALTNSGTFTIDAGASGTVYGAYTGSGKIIDNGSLYLNANSVAGPISGNGNLTIGSTSSGPAVVQLAANSGLSTLASLSLNSGSTLDIANNLITINYGSGPDPISSIAAWIQNGYNGGTWKGTGIMSTNAQINPNYGIGYADSADPGNPANLASGTIEIMYTLLGDANLDGKVNGIDFNLLATNFNQSVTNGWDKGDFNYDGKVNGNDFVLLADNFNQFASQSAVSTADWTALQNFAAANGISLANVPEPACTGIMVMAGLGILRRRQRSSSHVELIRLA